MMRIGPVDDDSEHLKLMQEFLGRYRQEEKVGFSIEEYRDGPSFVEDYDGTLGVVFLDIKMPRIGGMTAVEKIGERDQTLGIVFITNVTRFVIHGYEVNAIDFIIRPVSYYVFADRLKKTVRFSCTKMERELVVQTEKSIVELASSQLLYTEKDKDYLVYHTLKERFRVRGTLITLEGSLKGEGFFKCISGCLINLRYVAKISKDMVWVGRTPLPINRHQSRGFKEDFMRHLGGDYWWNRRSWFPASIFPCGF